MAEYDCAICRKGVSKELLFRNIRCPFCNSKVLLKSKSQDTQQELKAI